ncbi:proline-rich protein 2-like [Corythoichthys intestinalis]|uniref:proline-rich protein 2-like n=1 Tax=Corythoichthys intestinalis TaxID=161448 RepID=UPI0025A50746|nr:proline-rich protein 2-like [Corythoichthys intestinalis]
MGPPKGPPSPGQGRVPSRIRRHPADTRRREGTAEASGREEPPWGRREIGAPTSPQYPQSAAQAEGRPPPGSHATEGRLPQAWPRPPEPLAGRRENRQSPDQPPPQTTQDTPASAHHSPPAARAPTPHSRYAKRLRPWDIHSRDSKRHPRPHGPQEAPTPSPLTGGQRQPPRSSETDRAGDRPRGQMRDPPQPTLVPGGVRGMTPGSTSLVPGARRRSSGRAKPGGNCGSSIPPTPNTF